MKTLLTLTLLIAAAATLPAMVVGGGGGVTQPTNPNNPGANLSKPPAWIADPTEGGRQKGGVASWAAGTSKEEQGKARSDAIAALIATFKLPENAKVKEMDMWVDPQGKTFVLLKAR